MTHPPDDELVRLLLDMNGTIDADGSASVVDHVADCSQCQQVLADLTQVELLLGQVAEYAPVGPDPAVWDRVAVATGLAEPARPALEASDVEAGDPDPLRTRRHLRADAQRRRRLPDQLRVAAAAAVLLALGVGIGRWSAQPAQDQIVAQAELRSLDGQLRLGSAQVHQGSTGTSLVVQPQNRLDPAGGYVEVWLINTDLTRMISIGVALTDHPVQLTIPADALAQGYRIVDLSHEAYDDQPQHSGDSIMRGSLSS